jgi:undecaprenyl-diphosphatase
MDVLRSKSKPLLLDKTIFSVLFLAGLFFLLAFQYKKLVGFDGIVSNYIQELRSDELTEFFIFITYIGSYHISFPVVVVVSAYCLLNKKIWAGIIVYVNLFGARYLNGMLKETFSRDRPDAGHLVDVGGLSFPSGHSMNTAAFFGFLCYLLWFYGRKSSKNYIFFIAGIIGLILLIGISRIYLGVHYPSDVLGGFIAGGGWLLISVKLFRMIVVRE